MGILKCKLFECHICSCFVNSLLCYSRIAHRAIKARQPNEHSASFTMKKSFPRVTEGIHHSLDVSAEGSFQTSIPASRVKEMLKRGIMDSRQPNQLHLNIADPVPSRTLSVSVASIRTTDQFSFPLMALCSLSEDLDA